MLDCAEAFRRFPDPFRECNLWRVFFFIGPLFLLPFCSYRDQRDWLSLAKHSLGDRGAVFWCWASTRETMQHGLSLCWRKTILAATSQALVPELRYHPHCGLGSHEGIATQPAPWS